MKKGGAEKPNPWVETGEIGLLPYDARCRLKKAAETKIPPDDPLVRIRAMNEAAEWVKAEYLQFFKKEEIKL